MKIEVLPDYSFALKEVFSGVSLVSRDNEEFGICMRDSGFEFQYAGVWYEAKGGVINTLCGKPLLEGAKNTNNKPKKEDKLKEHPEMCPNCGEDAVTYERIALEHGEYVCDECGWGMNAITGEITNNGETC